MQKSSDSQHFHKTILQKILGLSERSGTRRATILRLTRRTGRKILGITALLGARRKNPGIYSILMHDAQKARDSLRFCMCSAQQSWD